MGFSKIDLSLYCGAKVAAEQASFVCLNPFAKEGSAMFVGASAERIALGGQVAAKLALQHFIESLLSSKNNPVGEEHVALLEAAYNKANSGVYEFAHKLSAGGRMSTSIVAILVDQGTIYATKVGHGQAYLIRSGKSFPFFSAIESDKDLQTLGTNSLVSVEIATVDMREADSLLIFSEELKKQDQAELADLATLLLPRFGNLDSLNRVNNQARGFTGKLDANSCQRLVEQIFDSELLAFAAIMGVGSNLNFLPESCKFGKQDAQQFKAAQ